MAVDWSLLQMPDVAGNALKAFDEGRKRRAYQDFARDPNSQQGVNALLAADPEMGFKALAYQRLAAKDRADAETTASVGDYVLASRGLPTGGAVPLVQRNALAPSPTPAQAQPAPAPIAPTADMTAGPQSGEVPKVDWSFLGKPRSAADAAFLRAVRSDPRAALKIDSELRDNMVKRLQAEHDFFDFAVSGLAGATDDPSYQSLVNDADRRATEMGLGSIRGSVPATFPGPEGIAQLRMRAVGSKDQIAALLRQDNADADNERADRNTDSVINDREARLAETRRYHNASDSTRRRGQDLGTSTTRRGQDIRGSGRGGGRAPIPTVSSPAEAMKLAPGTNFRTPDGTIRVRP